MKKIILFLFICLMATSVSAQNKASHASKPAQTSKTVKGGNSAIFARSGTYSFYSNALKVGITVNAYGRYSSVVVDGTEYLGTVKKGHIVAKEDDVVVFDGYMYNGGKVLRGKFYGKDTKFTRQ